MKLLNTNKDYLWFFHESIKCDLRFILVSITSDLPIGNLTKLKYGITINSRYMLIYFKLALSKFISYLYNNPRQSNTLKQQILKMYGCLEYDNSSLFYFFIKKKVLNILKCFTPCDTHVTVERPRYYISFNYYVL